MVPGLCGVEVSLLGTESGMGGICSNVASGFGSSLRDDIIRMTEPAISAMAALAALARKFSFASSASMLGGSVGDKRGGNSCEFICFGDEA